ncbi:hypothetical protein [Saccharopolyspora sp. NPDC049426]|uniref:hypothetical protein n=1 Tax=Saccharopolyspora sp. NPDC049426 TaxID=3155652 RepID=UPI00341F0942
MVTQLGEEALQFPPTADVSHTDSQQSSKCEWESNHPPGWGSPANATISVLVRLKVNEDGDPDIAAAQGSYQANNSQAAQPDTPPTVIGDSSKRSIRPGSKGNSQVVTIDFLRANAHVTVEYRGWGSQGFNAQFIPLEAQQEATLDFAQQTLARLGEPK